MAIRVRKPGGIGSPRKIGVNTKFEQIVKLANEGIWTLDANNLTDFINERGAAMLGYRPEEMLGRPVTDFTFSENKEDIERMPGTNRREGVERYVIRARRKDGSAVWLSSSTSPILGEDGSYQGALAVFTDITERKREKERSLREYDQLLSIFDSMDEPVYVADPQNYELLYINEAFRRLWGERIGRKCYDALQNRSAPCPFCTNRYIFGDNLGQTYIWAFQNENNRKWYRCIDRAIRWPDGRDVRFEMAIDVTDIKQAQKEMEESRAKLQAAFEAMTDAVFISDTEGNFVEVNGAFASFHRFRENEEAIRSLTLYPNYLEAWWPDGTSAPMDLWPVSRALRGETGSNLEIKIRRKDTGEEWWGSYGYAPIRDKDGEIVGSVMVARDITVRKKIEEALKEGEERFRTLADNIPQLSWMTDETGWIFWYNKQWFDYTGTTLDEMKGGGWQKVHHPDYVEKVTEKFRQYVGRGEAWEDTFPLRGKDGNYRWFLSRALPIKDVNGKVVRWFGTNTDITAELEAQRNLARSNAELKQFAYVASHDLQEPLRMVTAYLSLLKDRYRDQLDGRAKLYIDTAVQGGLKSRDLIQDLLDYSRVDARGEPFRETSMEAVLGRATNNLLVPIRENDAVVAHDPLPTIIADESQMVQVMQNLLSNAIKFHGDERPQVHVSSKDLGNKWLFCVRDNGIGIDPRHKDKLFVLFQRLHSQQQYPGTGIGLAISKKIIERHGGRIWFKSLLGKGTTFYFTVPKGARNEQTA